MDRSTLFPVLARSRLPILINRDYTLLTAGQAISSLGDAVLGTTIVLWIATDLARGQAWAPAAVGALVLIEEVSQVLVGPIAGVFADRWPKRRTMLITDGARAIVLSLLTLAAAFSSISFPELAGRSRHGLLGAAYLTMLVVIVCSQFFGPSRFALIGDIVPDERRALASSVGQTNAAICTILGPALAAPLFFGLGAWWALAFDALSFVVSFLAILLMRTRLVPLDIVSEAPPSVKEEFLDGLLVVRDSRVLRTLLLTGFVLMLGYGAVNALSIFFLQENLHASPHLFGVLAAAQGMGVIAGAIAAGIFAERIGIERLLWGASLLFGSAILAYSRLTSFGPGLVVSLLIGVAFAALEVAEAPLILRAAPRGYVGRVSAILVPAYAAGAALSALVAGWLASTVLRNLHTSVLGVTIGPCDALFGVAGSLAIIAGLYAMVNLRNPGSTVA
jgi:MFS family permease